jgi:tripartite-type tricarboxylate transporter receptor subunit TctC
MIRRNVLLMLAAFTAGTFLGLAASTAHAQYPERPIRFIIPQSPGGASDTVGRVVARGLSDRLGQQVVVDNRPGATGNIGHEIVKHAIPDGYTLLLTAPNLVTSPSLFAKLPFDPMRDFTPITQMTLSPNVWLVHPSFGAGTMAELVALARSKPGAIDYASSGLASTQHLAGELLNVMAGIKLNHVPYKGGGPALIDLLSGRMQVMSSTLPSAASHIRSGKVKALAVTSAKRSSAFPEMPTVAEAASLPGYEASTWQGLLFPAGTPSAVVVRLQKETAAVLALDAVRKRLSDLGYEPVATEPAAFSAFIKAEVVKWAKVIKSAGIRLE